MTTAAGRIMEWLLGNGQDKPGNDNHRQGPAPRPVVAARAPVPAPVSKAAPAVPVRSTAAPIVRPTVPQQTQEVPGPSICVLVNRMTSAPTPYWILRGWRQVSPGVYLGYFKTRLGRCHGVIKWMSASDFGFYVHNVPLSILNGPHGACFEEVKPGKYRAHFAQLPQDLSSGVFYIETLLQEGFENDQEA